jgi:hypothetical protein
MNENFCLAGNYGPVAEETTTTSLRVTGAIPRELNGRYLRNGPNPMDRGCGASLVRRTWHSARYRAVASRARGIETDGTVLKSSRR